MSGRTLEEIHEEQAKLKIEQSLYFQNAMKSGDVEAIFKAQQFAQKMIPNPEGGKAIVIDPFNRNVNFGFYDKPSLVNFSTLRSMSQTTIPNAILTTRRAQIVEFTEPQTSKYSAGFIIRKKRKSYSNDSDNKLTKQEQKEIDILTEFVLNCGDEENRWMSEDFGVFAQKFIEDSLALDQGCFEVVRGRVPRLEGISEFYAVDGATIRLADSFENERAAPKELINGYAPSYVQLLNGQIQTEWYPWELCLGIRNPQTNIFMNGYGKSELEILINTVTDILNASSYNSNYFRIGSNPKGILKVKGMNTARIEEFRQNWIADMAGVNNSHKLPIIDADSLDFINTQASNKDMEYHKYLEFLIKLSCAIYKISPEEIGFTLEGSGQGGGLGSGDNKTELEYSRNKGLIPLLKYLQKCMNKFLISPKSRGKYELVFLGLNQETEKDELESDVKKVTNGGMSMQDFFKKYSQREFDEEEDIILNPIYLQYKQMQMMGNPESNEYMDQEDQNEEVDDDNPFLEKAQSFLDQELSQETITI